LTFPLEMKAQTQQPLPDVDSVPAADGRARAWTTPVALAAIHLLLALAAFDPTPHTGGDNAAYVALARSILEHGRYIELWDPATPPHILYPPGFPALLALAMLLGLKPWVGLKLLIVATSTAAVAFSYLWLERQWGRRTAIGIGILLAASPAIVDMSHWVLSDVPFWLLTMVALWGFARLEAGMRGGAAIGIAATVFAYFTRSAGLPLVLAAATWLAQGRRWRTLAALAAAFLPLATLWWLRGRGVEGAAYVEYFWLTDPYRPELGRIGLPELVSRMWANNSRYTLVHLPMLLVGNGRGMYGALGVGVALLALAGWGSRLRRPGLPELFLPLYIGLLYVWPAVWAGERFLLPVLPLVLAYGAHALAAVARRVRLPWPHGVEAAVISAIVLLALPAHVAGVRRGVSCVTAYRLGEQYPCLSPPWRDYFTVVEWARDNLPEDAVVLTRKPRLYFGLTGRHARLYPWSPEPAELVRGARGAGARFIVLDLLDGQSNRYLIPAMVGRPEAFCAVYTLGPGRATVFALMPDAEAVPDRESGDGRAEFAFCPPDYLSPSR